LTTYPACHSYRREKYLADLLAEVAINLHKVTPLSRQPQHLRLCDPATIYQTTQRIIPEVQCIMPHREHHQYKLIRYWLRIEYKRKAKTADVLIRPTREVIRRFESD